MCGIAGVFKFNNPKYFINDTLKILEPRGPDNFGVYNKKEILLIHSRLSILDLDNRSNQPMEGKRWVLVFNGEIYNFQELKTELSKKISFETSSDTEVLLNCLEIWGLEKTLYKINGMFAFAAFDKEKEELVLARDHIGMKPLFYNFDEKKNFYFASTPEALINLNGQKKVINSNALLSYFSLGANFSNYSMYDGLFKVPSANYMIISATKNYKKKYWEPKYNSNYKLDDFCHMYQEYEKTDVVSKIFCSGGLDSSFLTSISSNKNIDCIHLASNEENYAKIVAKKLKKNLEIIKPNDNEIDIYALNSMKFWGEPQMSVHIPSLLCAELKKKKIKMAISANGADELLFGYPRTPFDEKNTSLPFNDVSPSSRNFLEQINHIFRNSKHYSLMNFKNTNFSCSKILYNFIENDKLNNFSSNANHRWFELKSYVEHDLNQTSDSASMSNSVELRFPFLDKRAIEGFLSLQEKDVVTVDYGRKHLLKKYLSEKGFDNNFLFRPKQGFSVNRNIFQKYFNKVDKLFYEFEKKNLITIDRNKISGRDLEYIKYSLYNFSIWEKENNLNLVKNI